MFIVLATLMVVIILATVILSIMSSQSRLTHHEVSRIQAYYAALAGMNLAYDMLRVGDNNVGTWPKPAALTDKYYIRYLCKDADPDSDANCQAPGAIIDSNIPASISLVRVTVTDSGATSPPAPAACTPPAGSQVCINATATYTLQ